MTAPEKPRQHRASNAGNAFSGPRVGKGSWKKAMTRKALFCRTAPLITSLMAFLVLHLGQTQASALYHVASNTGLQGLASTAYPVVIRDGYARAGDAPPLQYLSSNSACSLRAGSGDNGSQVRSSDGKCWIASFPASGSDLREFGAKGDGFTDDSTALQSWLNYGNIGGHLTSSPGNYLFGSPLSLALKRDIEIDVPVTAHFILKPGITNIGFYLDGARNAHGLIIKGGYWDGSKVTDVPPSVGQMWEFANGAYLSVSAAEFYATASYGNNKGDTAFAATNVNRAAFVNNKFWGWHDSCIYITGGASSSSTDDGGPTTVTGNSFNGCGTAITEKRQAAHTTVSGNTFRHDSTGVDTESVGIANLPPGTDYNIRGNDFDEEGSPIALNGSGHSKITGNRITDWGYDPFSMVALKNPNAVNLNGASDTQVVGNSVGFRKWTAPVSSVCFAEANATIDKVVYTAQNNAIKINTCSGAHYGIYEGSRVGASSYSNNDFHGVATNLVQTNPSDQLESGL